MGSNFKREIAIGILSIIIFLSFVVAFVFQYQSKKIESLTTSPSVKTLENELNAGGVVTAKTQLTTDLVGQHNASGDCWIIVQNKVYSVSSYLYQHPGGAEEITPFCGREATQAFISMGGRGSHSQKAYDIIGTYYVGELNGAVNGSQSSTVSTTPTQTSPIRVGGSERKDDDD